MTDQDRADLVFGIDQDVDFVAASFVRNAEGVKCPRCWMHSTKANADGLCPRCAAVVAELDLGNL